MVLLSLLAAASLYATVCVSLPNNIEAEEPRFPPYVNRI
jgi:hypothetical protein